MGLDLLVFGAHPDDVEISCGGMIHKMAAAGHQVGICDMTRGEAGTRGTPEGRREEAENARRILGAEVRVNLGLPDTRLSHLDRAHLEAVVAVLRAHRPRVVIAPYWLDQHPDHEEASMLVTRGCFVAGLGKFGNPTEGRHRPVSVLYTMFRRPFEVAFLVDVSASFEKKVEAIQAHRSQVFAEPGDPSATRLTRADFFDQVRARGRFYGSRIGAEYAEAFTSREELAVDDPVRAFAGERSDRVLG